MIKILNTQETFEMISYVDKTLRKVNSCFYYNTHMSSRVASFVIHNHELEEKFPLLFPKDAGCYISTLVNLYSMGYSLDQSFILGSNRNNEGEEWKAEVKMASLHNINRLIKEFGQILVPDKNLDIIDARYGDTKITPSIINFFGDNKEYYFTMLTLERVIEKELKDLPLELNLKIFYEFFEDLSHPYKFS
ncbi:MAG: hypothetical protein AABW56_04580 [Nanoarchaeota archaeon]